MMQQRLYRRLSSVLVLFTVSIVTVNADPNTALLQGAEFQSFLTGTTSTINPSFMLDEYSADTLRNQKEISTFIPGKNAVLVNSFLPWLIVTPIVGGVEYAYLGQFGGYISTFGYFRPYEKGLIFIAGPTIRISPKWHLYIGAGTGYWYNNDLEFGGSFNFEGGIFLRARNWVFDLGITAGSFLPSVKVGIGYSF